MFGLLLIQTTVCVYMCVCACVCVHARAVCDTQRETGRQGDEEKEINRFKTKFPRIQL